MHLMDPYTVEIAIKPRTSKSILCNVFVIQLPTKCLSIVR